MRGIEITWNILEADETIAKRNQRLLGKERSVILSRVGSRCGQGESYSADPDEAEGQAQHSYH